MRYASMNSAAQPTASTIRVICTSRSVPGRAKKLIVPERQIRPRTIRNTMIAIRPKTTRQAQRPARRLPATICADPGRISVINNRVSARLNRTGSRRLRRSGFSCGMTSFRSPTGLIPTVPCPSLSLWYDVPQYALVRAEADPETKSSSPFTQRRKTRALTLLHTVVMVGGGSMRYEVLQVQPVRKPPHEPDETVPLRPGRHSGRDHHPARYDVRTRRGARYRLHRHRRAEQLLGIPRPVRRIGQHRQGARAHQRALLRGRVPATRPGPGEQGIDAFDHAA